MKFYAVLVEYSKVDTFIAGLFSERDVALKRAKDYFETNKDEFWGETFVDENPNGSCLWCGSLGEEAPTLLVYEIELNQWEMPI